MFPLKKTIKTGLMGGAFDPFHLAHLNSLLTVRKKFSFDKLVLIPSFKTPLKKEKESASPFHRLEMLKVLISSYPFMETDPQEILRKGTSNTCFTIDNLFRSRPTEDLFFIIGLDQFFLLDQWKNWQDILKKSHFVVVSRAGFRFPSKIQEIPKGLRPFIQTGGAKGISFSFTTKKIHFCPLNEKNISSSDIRQRLRKGLCVDHLLPPALIPYIKKHRLYIANQTLTKTTPAKPNNPLDTANQTLTKTTPAKPNNPLDTANQTLTKTTPAKGQSTPQAHTSAANPPKKESLDHHGLSFSQSAADFQTKAKGQNLSHNEKRKTTKWSFLQTLQTKDLSNPSHNKHDLIADPKLSTKKLLALSQSELEKKQAFCIKSFDLRHLPLPFSFGLTASTSNTRQNRQIAKHLKHKIKEHFDLLPLNEEGLKEAHWVALDYGELVIHIFYDLHRRFYQLDQLWESRASSFLSSSKTTGLKRKVRPLDRQ